MEPRYTLMIICGYKIYRDINVTARVKQNETNYHDTV